MNDDTVTLLYEAVDRLKTSIQARDCPAIVVMQGTRKLILSDYDYNLNDKATAAEQRGEFERRAAAHAKEIKVVRWIFAVPQVWVNHPGVVLMRAVSNHPLREGEQEAIVWMSYDGTDGVDYGRVLYTRRPSGEPVFDEPEIFTAEVRASQAMPGIVLLQTLMEDSS